MAGKPKHPPFIFECDVKQTLPEMVPFFVDAPQSLGEAVATRWWQCQGCGEMVNRQNPCCCEEPELVEVDR